MEMKFKKMPTEKGNLIENPKYATDGSACFDLVCNIDEEIIATPGSITKIPTGIAIEIPSNEYVALVFARSGLASKSGISLANSVGVVDSDYRGEIFVPLINNSKVDYTFKQGDRVAQLGIFPVIMTNLIETNELNDTKRGSGGFGSTGA